MTSLPEVKPGVVAVSRDRFIISLSERRRAAIKAAGGKALFEAFKFLGVRDIARNQPKSLPCPAENPFDWAV